MEAVGGQYCFILQEFDTEEVMDKGKQQNMCQSKSKDNKTSCMTMYAPATPGSVFCGSRLFLCVYTRICFFWFTVVSLRVQRCEKVFQMPKLEPF